MGLISIPKTFSDNENPLYTDVNSNWSTIYNEFNGNIENANIKSNAAIAYSKLNLTGSILNADVNASAAIAYSKLNLATSILNSDIASGASIAYSKLNLLNSIVNSDVASTASISYTKLNLTGSIVNADVSGSAAIDVTKISGTAVNLNSTQTISGQKTFSGANTFSGNNTFSEWQTFSKAVKTSLVTLTDAATTLIDANLSNTFRWNMGAQTRTANVTNATIGQWFALRTTFGTSACSINWFSGISWVQGVAPTLTSTHNKTDTFLFLTTGANTYDGYVVGQNI